MSTTNDTYIEWAIPDRFKPVIRIVKSDGSQLFNGWLHLKFLGFYAFVLLLNFLEHGVISEIGPIEKKEEFFTIRPVSITER